MSENSTNHGNERARAPGILEVVLWGAGALLIGLILGFGLTLIGLNLSCLAGQFGLQTPCASDPTAIAETAGMIGGLVGLAVVVALWTTSKIIHWRRD